VSSGPSGDALPSTFAPVVAARAVWASSSVASTKIPARDVRADFAPPLTTTGQPARTSPSANISPAWILPNFIESIESAPPVGKACTPSCEMMGNIRRSLIAYPCFPCAAPKENAESKLQKIVHRRPGLTPVCPVLPPPPAVRISIFYENWAAGKKNRTKAMLQCAIPPDKLQFLGKGRPAWPYPIMFALAIQRGP